jgi:hypothetical protein
MAKSMRAKVYVSGIEKYSETSETIKFSAISKNGGYPSDGSDEDNTYAKFSPSAHFNINIANPDLIGQYNIGEKYYVDFTPVKDETQMLEDVSVPRRAK